MHRPFTRPSATISAAKARGRKIKTAPAPHAVEFSGGELNAVFGPVADSTRVALAVSGGCDSLALMMLAERWASARSQPKISVLTVDHGLRAEAAGEAALVGGWARASGFDHATLRWDGPKPATGLQAAARAARYRLMAEWCRSRGVPFLLTAHTIDDQAETVLMRLTRGTGIDGLAGIRPRLELAGVTVLRPLLGVSRGRLRSALMAAGRQWIEDPSNSDARFERVRIRQAVPQLAALGLTPAALAETARRAREAWQALAMQADEFLAIDARHHPEGYGEIDLARFAALPRDLRGRVLHRLLGLFGGERDEPLSLAAVERLAEVEAWGQPARTLGGCKLVRRTRSLLVGREFGRIDPAPLLIGAEGSRLWDGRFLVTAAPGNKIVPAGILPSVRSRRDLPAFVQASLPAVIDKGGAVEVPHLSAETRAEAVFVARKPC